MKQIICNLAQFSYNHAIYLADDENNVVTLTTAATDELIEKLFNCAVVNDTFSVHLFGDRNYIEPFGEELASRIMANYANKEFEILFN